MEPQAHTILLVEDDLGQARLTLKALERRGFQVRHVAGAQACLDAAREQPPTFVLLDRGLPDGDGLQVLDTLRAEFPNTCVIMLTGADDTSVAVDAMRQGAWDYVVKRPDLSHLTDLPLVLDRNRERLRLMREHEALNAAVRASEERFRELFDNASDAIFVCDPHGVLQQVNQAFLDLTGCERTEVEGRSLGTLLAASSPTDAHGLQNHSLRGHQSSTVEVHLSSCDGRTVVLDVKARPIRVEGALCGVQGIGRDVTERRRVDQMKADFLAMVTHDMKNPVSIIVGYVEILLNDSAADSQSREMLISIDSSARGLLHLIMNFLDLSKIEAGALRVRRAQTNLNEILHQVLQYQAPLAHAKRINVAEEFAALPVLQLDQAQMERVFTNLISNAIKFTPPTGRISVHTARHNGVVEVRVSDTGRGIQPEQMPQLFGKYQRLAPAAETEGTGLGLFIAKSMIEAHGGAVHVESTPSRGTTFVVSLPIAN